MPRAADWNTSDWNAPTATIVDAWPRARVRRPMSISAFHTSFVSAVPGVKIAVDPTVGAVPNAGADGVAVGGDRKNCPVGMAAGGVASPPLLRFSDQGLAPTFVEQLAGVS